MLRYRIRFFITTAYYSWFTRSFSYRCSFNRRDRCCRIFCTRHYSFLSYWCFNILCSCWNWCSITNCCTYLISFCYRSYRSFRCNCSSSHIWSHRCSRNYWISNWLCWSRCTRCFLRNRHWSYWFSCCYSYSGTKYASHC